MKKFIVIWSMFMLFKPILPMVEYVVLYDYIKNELCVNKDKLELACNGKCHLSKEMANASDNDTEKHRFSSAESHIITFQEIDNNFFVTPIIPLVDKTNFIYTITYHFSFSDFIFRPPIIFELSACLNNANYIDKVSDKRGQSVLRPMYTVCHGLS